MYETGRPGFASPFTRPPPATMALMVATVATSVVAMFTTGWTRLPVLESLSCVPAAVIRDFKFWTPITYAFVTIAPGALLLYLAFGLWMFAAPLERTWGPRRLLVYFFATTVGTAVLTALISIPFPSLGVRPLQGAYIATAAILLAWVLLNWNAPVYFFFIPMRAQFLLVLVVGVPALMLLLGQVAPVVPIFLALGIGYGIVGGRFNARRALLRLRASWIEWQLRRRSGHLRVVPRKNGEEPKRYLH